MKTAPILYVEDEEDYQILVTRILGHAGLEVVTAETGRDGLDRLERERPSLLILDINLPDMDGYAICNQLRRDPAWVDLPVLMLTVRRRPEEWLRGFSSGANDYISKPINPPELIERVVQCLEGKASPFSEQGSAEYKLIQAAVAGNRTAFQVLVEQHRPRLLDNLRPAVKNPALLEDIAAQAFARAYEKLGQFRGEASFYTWMYRIALNELTTHYRKPGAVSLDALTDGDESALPIALASPDTAANAILDAQEADGAQALEALSRVPAPYRRMLELFFMRGMSYDAIAKKLGIPIGTVMSRLHKARKLLQDAWNLPAGIAPRP